MTFVHQLRHIALAGLICGLPVVGSAQEIDLAAYPTVRESDLAEAYRAWLQEEVVWIITPSEREVFLRLQTDEQRDQFIRAFWVERDPTPGTPGNEYLTLHYERLAYADHAFGREAPGPGWRTDMGRIHILLGEPQSRHSFHNESALYPVEVWMYQADTALGVPSFFYVVFFREQGMGHFELYSPVTDGPTALLNASGDEWVRNDRGLQRRGNTTMGGVFGAGRDTYEALRLIHADLADAAFSLIPGEAFVGSPLRSEAVLADISMIPERLMPTVAWAYPILSGATETDVRFETMDLEARAIGWIDTSGVPFVSYVLRAPGPAVNVAEYDDQHYMTFRAASYLVDSKHQVLGSSPPRRYETPLSSDHLGRIRDGELIYVGRMPAIAGEFNVELMLENNVTNEYGEVGVPVSVPSLNPDVPTLGRPVLAASARDMGSSYDPMGGHFPLQIGRLAISPVVDGPFATGGRMTVYHQVVLPAQVAGALSVTYTLSTAAGVDASRTQIGIDPASADRFGVLNQVTTLTLDVDPGAYELTVTLDATGESHTLPFRVSRNPTRSIVHAAAVPPPSELGAVLRRAELLRAAREPDAALDLVGAALQRSPRHPGALALQVELLDELEEYEQLQGVLEGRLVESPHDIDLLERLAEVLARQGEHYDAIRYYERAVLQRSDSPVLLNALAAEYLAAEAAGLDDLDRAIELLERSLAQDPDQSGIETTLERARAAREQVR